MLVCMLALQGLLVGLLYLDKAPTDRQPPFVDAPLAASAWQPPSLLPFPSSRPLGMPRWSTNLCRGHASFQSRNARTAPWQVAVQKVNWEMAVLDTLYKRLQ